MGYQMLEYDRELFIRGYRNAQGYHRRTQQFSDDGQPASLIFNTASVALESYLTALCALHGAMPEHHNYTCLMDAAETVVTFPPDLIRQIRALDQMFDICSLDEFNLAKPGAEDAERVLKMCDHVATLFDPERVAAAQTGRLL